MSKKIVVTGASGFLGSHLVNKLKEESNMISYALSTKGDELQKKNLDEHVTYCNKDLFLINDELLRNAIIVNCAFPRNATGEGVADGLCYIQQLFDRAVDCGAKAIINISSQSVYSQLRTTIATEESPICLESPYAVGKYATELMLMSACRDSKTFFTNLRMASLIGPGFDQRIVNRFVLKMIKNEAITVARQEKEMGFLDVDDAVLAILSIISVAPEQWNSVYNVGNGKAYTIEEIFKEVSLVVEEKIGKTSLPNFEERDDFSSTRLSYSCLNHDTGFEPKVTLQQSIKKIVDYIVQ